MSRRRHHSGLGNHTHNGGAWAFLERPLARTLLGVIFLFAVVFLLYSPSLHGGFLLDDNHLLTKNGLIQSPGGLYRLWFTSDSVDYWPVSNTTLWLEWRLWGKESTGYHATNDLLHATACLLLWLVLARLSIPGAYFAALLFAVHPVNVESIAWIAQRKDALAAVFFLLSVCGYVEAERRLGSFVERWRSPDVLLWQLFSLAMFVLAGLSKGSALTLPLVLILVICWRRRPVWQDAVRLTPFFGAAGAMVWANIWFQTHGGSAIRDTGLVERALQAGAVTWFYLYKAILPFHLLFVYPPWKIDLHVVWWWIPTAAAIVLTGVLWRYRSTWGRPLLFAWLYFLAALAPVMGFTDISYMQFSLVADHYQHLALLGVTACAAAGASLGWDRTRGWRRGAVAAASLGVFLLLSVLCYRQNELYKDADTLYGATIAENPDCAILYNELGDVAMERDNLPEAKRLTELAIQTKPDYANAYNNLAVVNIRLGNNEEAIRLFHKAAELDPDIAKIRINLAKLAMTMGRHGEAIEQLAIVLQRDPRDLGARLGMADAMAAEGRIEDAIALLKEVRTVRSRSAEDENALGMAFFLWGRVSDALQCFQNALELDPDFGKAYYNRGIILFRMKRMKEAAEQFKEALRCDPAKLNAYMNLAEIYVAEGRIDEGIAMAEKGAAAARSNGDKQKAAEFDRWIENRRPTP